LTAAQQEQLKTEAATGRFKSAAMAQAFIGDTFHKTFSLSGVRKLLTRLGFSFHKASSFLFKAKRDKQEEFVKDYEQDKPKVQSDGWRRYFIDGVHPLYGMEVLYYCWLPVGKRLELGVGGGRKRLNILGAFCPDDHEYIDRRYTDENLTAQSVIALFERMRELHPETRHFRIYLDNARYQHAKVLKAWVEQTKAQTGVTFDLKYLPAYSPNLNLIERLWKFMRKEALQTWHKSFEKMQEAVAGVLDHLPGYEEQLRTLMTERFHLTPELSTLVVGPSCP
jgi:transposase